MKKLKGIVLVVIFLLASIMMPFDVYAAVQSTIAPTFSSGTTEWNGHLHITNFSDGTDNQASSTLSFTLDDDYYGVIYFDGYGPSNQHIANYAAVFVAGGYGEYRYSYYQNGIINITNVTVNIVNVVKPGSSVDLTQIVSLLTAIENDTSSLDNLLDSTLDEIRDILSELIVSNGYLETLSKIRQWNIPFESFGFVHYLMSNNYPIFDYSTYNYYYFPIFKLQQNDLLMSVYIRNGRTFRFILGVNAYWTSESNIRSALNVPNTLTIENISTIDTVYSKTISGYGSYLNIVRFDLSNTSGSGVDYKAYVNNAQYQNTLIVPIYANFINYNVSTDFALRFGLSNRLLDDIHLIASGTNQSNQAASDLESGNSQMADDMNDLATIESGYNQQFNNQLQQIDFTSPLQNNAGILPAANFVITIFNGLINNNPFSVLIIVVCILLIGKKVIGK